MSCGKREFQKALGWDRKILNLADRHIKILHQNLCIKWCVTNQICTKFLYFHSGWNLIKNLYGVEYATPVRAQI